MSSDNSITVVGNATRAPELRYTPNGAAVVKLGMACNRFYTNRNGEKVEQTDFFNVNAWRELAENIAESVTIGQRIIVSGRLQSRSWETDDGSKRTSVEIEADEVGPSLRWATAQVTKATRGGPGEWAPKDTAPVGAVPEKSSDADWAGTAAAPAEKAPVERAPVPAGDEW